MLPSKRLRRIIRRTKDALDPISHENINVLDDWVSEEPSLLDEEDIAWEIIEPPSLEALTLDDQELNFDDVVDDFPNENESQFGERDDSLKAKNVVIDISDGTSNDDGHSDDDGYGVDDRHGVDDRLDDYRLDELTEEDIYEMIFDSDEDGKRFYNAYAKVKDFSVQKDHIHLSIH
ncbi:hypothetical protein RHSIM_Rhsim04G0142400 [Rhododendron simsii]|uniref:Uncharacterized protein n=1 Tax=Rhododendron simsii TaxID=118357 RepID=A0A834H7E4_RHOSS|nr:hypothetical protein RHSIM_Rhsim04G0142400 [Rhododendron simsii]